MKKNQYIVWLVIIFILVSIISFSCSVFYFRNIAFLELLDSAEAAVSGLYFDDNKSPLANDISLEKITQARNSIERLIGIGDKENLLNEIDDISNLLNIKASMDKIFKDGILIVQNEDTISKINKDIENLKKHNNNIYISLRKDLEDINAQNHQINEIRDKVSNLLKSEDASREEYDLVLVDINKIKNLSIKENLLTCMREVDSSIAQKESQGFSNITSIDDSIIVDLKYATKENFTGKKIYDFENAIARTGSCKKLVAANEELKALGYRIKIWDAYRPGYAQEALWQAFPDPNFVAIPDPNCSHELGTTFDVTLCDLNGNEIIMQSSFDDFSERAYRNFKRSDEEEKYYKILDDAMTNAGFVGYFSEWWDYTDKNECDYVPMQVDPKLY